MTTRTAPTPRSRAVALSGTVLAIGACHAQPLDALGIDAHSLAADLVAHWRFDETGGTTVSDSSGNGHDGTLTGGAWIPIGRFGGALRLGIGDHVTVDDFPQATHDWSVSVWTRSSAAQLVANTSDGQTILSTENVFAGGWQLHLDNRPGYDQFDAAYFVGSDASVTPYVVADCHCIETDRWIHLTAVFDGAGGELTFYRDADVADRIRMPSPISDGDTTLYMGTWNMMTRYLAADIDDFAVWSRALTPGEISYFSQYPASD